MIGLAYRILLALHPAEFRDRFGDEMLWIFDQGAGMESVSLCGDALTSLLRQRLLRSNLWNFAAGALLTGLIMMCFGSSLKVPMGQVQSYRLESAILGGGRTICVYTPPGYDPQAKSGYRLLVLSDGLSYGNWFSAVSMFDGLIRSQNLPPVVSVWIDDPPTDGVSSEVQTATSVNFLDEELLPWLHERWNVTYDPQKTIIGSTGGGAAVVLAAVRRPDLFGNVLSQSNSFWQWHDDATWEFLTSENETDPTLSVHFFIEAGPPVKGIVDGATLLAADRHFPEVLRSRGYRVTSDQVGGTQEPVHWQETLPQGLMALMR